MAENDIAPGFIKLFYNSNGHSHQAILPCLYNPPSPAIGSDPVLAQKGGTTQAASAAVAAYVTAIKTMLPATGTFTGWEAYSKAAGLDPVFLYGDDLAVVGTSGGSVQPNTQVVVSFRTGAGGVMKLYLMEGGQAANQRVAARTTAAAPFGAFITYILGNTNWVVGRDNGFPTFGLWVTTKVNDALRKKFVLNN